MLPQKFRLPYGEFSARGYQTIKTPFFSLKFRKNELPNNRIGIIIGVSAEKSAVRRNFWKRQAKAILAKPGAGWYPGKQPGIGKDFVLIFSKKIKEIKKDEFKKELLKILS